MGRRFIFPDRIPHWTLASLRSKGIPGAFADAILPRIKLRQRLRPGPRLQDQPRAGGGLFAAWNACNSGQPAFAGEQRPGLAERSPRIPRSAFDARQQESLPDVRRQRREIVVER